MSQSLFIVTASAIVVYCSYLFFEWNWITILSIILFCAICLGIEWLTEKLQSLFAGMILKKETSNTDLDFENLPGIVYVFFNLYTLWHYSYSQATGFAQGDEFVEILFNFKNVPFIDITSLNALTFDSVVTYILANIGKLLLFVSIFYFAQHIYKPSHPIVFIIYETLLIGINHIIYSLILFACGKSDFAIIIVILVILAIIALSNCSVGW